MKKHRILAVEPGSIAEELEIAAGDYLVSIDGREIIDLLDYQDHLNAEQLVAVLETPDGQTYECEIEKDAEEDLGLSFEGIMDPKRVCRNHCIFCFIDQLPKTPSVRSTLLLKDDDWRLSFLMGNYITLTNVDEAEFARILRLRISPLYISVHALDPLVRKEMMRNQDAGLIAQRLRRLCDAGIDLHAQIVCCPGYNDGQVLMDTIEGLYAMREHIRSVAVVPVGLTAHREGLTPLVPFSQKTAEETIAAVSALSERYAKECGRPFVYCSDEFYTKAAYELPPFEWYGEFEQIENGVGMLRLFEREVEQAIAEIGKKPVNPYRATLATGFAAYSFLLPICDKIAKTLGIELQLAAVENRFFGGQVNVSGLLTGQDYRAAFAGKELGKLLFIPGTSLNADRLFLDGTDLPWLRQELGCDVRDTGQNGFDFIKVLVKASV